MGTLDVVLAVVNGVIAGLYVAIGVAMLLRSRQQPGPILWRGQPLFAPRLAACFNLFVGLLFATLAVSPVLFEPGSIGNGLMFLVATVFVAATTVTGIIWFRRKGRAARHPASS